MRLKQKLKSRAGFTLAETLLAVLILLLVSVIVATGMPAAKNAYEKVVVAANAQVLLSTTVNALQDELATAWDVRQEPDSITYYSTNTGARSKIFKDSQGNIKIQEYIDMDGIIDSASTAEDASSRLKERLLVTEKAATSDLMATFDSVVVTQDTTGSKVTFNNVKSGIKKNGKIDTELIKIDAITIPVFSMLEQKNPATGDTELQGGE